VQGINEDQSGPRLVRNLAEQIQTTSTNSYALWYRLKEMDLDGIASVHQPDAEDPNVFPYAKHLMLSVSPVTPHPAAQTTATDFER
jgi:hypothetical protein